MDWDAVSLPAGFAPSHVDTSMLDRKEIATPSFSTAAKAGPSLKSNNVRATTIQVGYHAMTGHGSIWAELFEACVFDLFICWSNDIVWQLPEDLAPAAFAQRHDPQELRELAAWNTQKKGSTKALAIQPARPCKPRHFKACEQYPKRTFPLSAEEQAKLKVVHDDSSVFSVAALPALDSSNPTETAHPAFKLVFKLKKQDA
jgi:hypothetical protein